MLKVSFTFCAQRESNPQMSMALFKEHFPGSMRLGYAMRLDNFYRVTCSSEEFCKWIHQRDQMGFVNRMHYLNMHVQTIDTHYQHQLSSPPVRAGYAANPIAYETPESSGVKEAPRYYNV